MPEQLKALANNPALMEELRKYLMQKFELSTIPSNTDNAKLGELVRARLDGRLLVDEAFREIAGMKNVETRVAQMPGR